MICFIGKAYTLIPSVIYTGLPINRSTCSGVWQWGDIVNKITPDCLTSTCVKWIAQKGAFLPHHFTVFFNIHFITIWLTKAIAKIWEHSSVAKKEVQQSKKHQQSDNQTSCKQTVWSDYLNHWNRKTVCRTTIACYKAKQLGHYWKSERMAIVQTNESNYKITANFEKKLKISFIVCVTFECHHPFFKKPEI